MSGVGATEVTEFSEGENGTRIGRESPLMMDSRELAKIGDPAGRLTPSAKTPCFCEGDRFQPKASSYLPDPLPAKKSPRAQR